MTDQTAGADHSSPDYELDEALALNAPEQYRALFEATRQRIVGLLLERAATTTELAEVLGKPKGTVGHHLKVLEEAGLVRVVRTEKVRALQAKYYGRTARVFFFDRVGEAVGEGQRVLAQAAAEVGAIEEALTRAGGEQPGHEAMYDVNRRDVRIPPERAVDFRHRLAELLTEFADEPRAGSTTFAMVYAIYETAQAPLPSRSPELPGGPA